MIDAYVTLDIESFLRFCTTGIPPKFEAEATGQKEDPIKLHIRLKDSACDTKLEMSNIVGIHILLPRLEKKQVRQGLPLLVQTGIPIYTYVENSAFAALNVSASNPVATRDLPKATPTLDDPALDIHAWLHILWAATDSHVNLSRLLDSPTSDHVAALLEILEKANGSSHAFKVLKSKLHQSLEKVEAFGDLTNANVQEYRDAQKLRVLLSKQRLTVPKLPEFLYHAIRNIRIKGRH